MELQPSTDGIYSLFSQLCSSVLSQVCAEGENRHDHLHTNFAQPKYDILTRGLDRERAVQCLFRTTFDLIILRKWVWFNTWQTDMSPVCRCLAHTYELNLKGRQEDAVCLEHAITCLASTECPLQEKNSILKFLTLMAGCGKPEGELSDPVYLYSPKSRVNLPFLERTGLWKREEAPFVPEGSSNEFHYESYPSSLFEQLPAEGGVRGLHTAMLDSTELFQCAPGTGFTGFFTAKAKPPSTAPRATTLFDGLAHCVTSDLNTPLDIPSIPSQPDSITLLPHGGEKGKDCQTLGRRSANLSDSGCGLSLDDSTLSLLSSLAMTEDTALPTRAWEGWEDSKQYLSETTGTTFDHSVGVCLSHMSRLTGIDLPLEVTGGPGALRTIIDSLDTLPPTVLLSLEEGGSIARAFARALSTLLLHCQIQLHKLKVSPGQSDIGLQSSANGIFHLLQFVLNITNNTMACPQGLSLLDRLYTQAMSVQGTPHYPLLLSLLRLAAMPYLQFVCQWVFHGWLDREEEFGLQAHEGFLTRRDHLYWTEGYTASSPCTPEFLRHLSTAFMAAGKALNLLRMCCPTHPLCDSRLLKPPSVVLAVSMDELDGIRQQCHAYSSMVSSAVEQQKEERRLQELEREQQEQEVVIRARQEARQAVERSRSFEQAQLQAIHERKRALQIDLKRQMEEARALRTEREAEEREADKELMDAIIKRETALKDQERQLEEEAKAELVAYYAELSREAEVRRLRAEWRVKRLELSVERHRFLLHERELWGRQMEEKTKSVVESVSLEHLEVENEETTQHVSDRPQEDGQRTRRTWAESQAHMEAEPSEPGGRKTWVASLIESVPPLPFSSPLATDQADIQSSTLSAPVTPSTAQDDGLPLELHDLPPNSLAPSTPLRQQPSTPDQSPNSSHKESPSHLQRSPSFLSQHYSPDRTGRRGGADDIPRRKVVPGSGVHDSVIQTILYSEGGDGCGGPVRSDQAIGTEAEVPAGLESGHGDTLTPRLVTSRGHATPSVAQDIIYPEAIGETPKTNLPEDLMTPRLISSRGNHPPSVARDIIYPQGRGEGEVDGGTRAAGDLLTPRLISSRGHAPPSVIQDIMYPQDSTQRSEDPFGPRLVSSRGQAPPSTIQEILYSGGNFPAERFHSTRGAPPPTSIQYKLYPDKYAPSVEVTNHTVQEEEKDVSMITLPPFQPYKDSYPELDLPPSVDFLEHVLGPLPPALPTDPDLLSVYPLPSLVNDSIALPILTQSRLVNATLVEHFMTEYQISRHFVALKRFLLLEDGEFGHSLATRLFEELTYGRSWRHLCSPSFLNPLLSSALDTSLHRHSPERQHISFALRHQPQGIKTHAVEALEFLELQYKVEWPCNIVITRDSIAKYNKVFQLLLQLKRASWALKNVFAHLKKCEGLEKGQHRQLQTYRHELQHFINVMEGYLMNQIFYLSWREFEVDLNQNVHSLDDLIAAHQRFIDKVIFRCLLSKKAKPVMNIIRGVFSAILRFSTQLTFSTLGPQGSYRAMCDTHRKFRDTAGLLIKVVAKLVQRGYQPHLEDFMLRLNFNGFYG